MRFIDNCIKNKIFDINNFDGSEINQTIDSNHQSSTIKIIVAVSGGADSLALADLLCRCKQRFNLKLCIAHFEHGLRGDDSLADAEFVKNFAIDRGLDYVVKSGDVNNFAQLNKLSIETAARDLRHKFLEETRQQFNFDTIALAHHADDQAETILMRILRGTGSVGLSAMKMKYKRLLRPLLNFKKSELEHYCLQRNLKPRIDSTNFESDATRNKIRLNLLPELKKYNPSIVDTLCRLGESSAEESDFIHSEALKIFPSAVKVIKKSDNVSVMVLSQKVVKAQHIAMQRALIKLFVECIVMSVRSPNLVDSSMSVKDFGFIHFESIRRVLTDNLKGVELPNKFRADLKRGFLSISKNFNVN
ncbi:MAG: tRNA lysidine(34) synthetase TilS [Selenomonadaceae bacterium]|nr:tRNA lysidine(34) synthetase TilS [Selenomonadaceae bacterium]MBR1859161.1 tRNA lysidine(34) synthetase TilS [Selenomonadaceae bacterium]